MAANLRPYTVRYVDTSGATDAGRQVDLVWKAWLYHDGQVFWEFRGPLYRLLSQAKASIKIAKWMKCNEGMLAAVMQQLGLDFSKEVLWSRRAQRASARQQDLQYTREEFCMSTPGVLATLLHWSISRHLNAEKHCSAVMLAALLRKVSDPKHLCQDEWQQTMSLRLAAPCCHVKAHGSPCCGHLGEVLREARPGAGQEPWLALSLGLGKLLQHCSVCPASKLALTSWVSQVAMHLNTRVGELNFECDPSKASLLRGAARRLRIDEDYKAAVSMELAKQKRVHSGSQLVKATAKHDPSLVLKWQHEQLRKYQAAGHRSFEKSTVVCIAEDACRVGEPKQETMVYICWTAKDDKAMFLPVQAPY